MARIFRSVARRRRARRPAMRLERLEPRLPLAVDVTTLANSGEGSLRAAIEAVNSSGKADIIVFKDLGAGTIHTTSNLPTLAVSGTAFAFSGTTTAITLDGSGAGSGGDGLIIGPGINSISLNGLALTIQNFAQNAISFAGGSTGTTIDGLSLRLNGFNGIQLAGGSYSGSAIRNVQISDNGRAGIVTAAAATGLTIGGTLANQGNNIYGNGTHGIELAAGAYTGSSIVGNRIVDNEQCGIATAGGVTSLTVGGTAAAAANTIAINTASGLQLGPGSYAGTTIVGNTISLNEAAGITFAIAGGSATGLVIGGTAAGAGNAIGENGTAGIVVSAGTYTGTAIQGNTINGNAVAGISLAPGAGTVTGLAIGGTAANAGNELNANDAVGLLVAPGTYTGTTVQGNAIQSNGSHGVSLAAAAGTIAALTIGGGNTITGNAGDGVNASAGTYTSTAVSGNTLSSNTGAGVRLAPGSGSLLGLVVGGSTKSSLGNTLAGNTAGGIVAAAGTYTGTLVQGNSVSGGTIGISLTGAQQLAVGGATSDLGNVVSGATKQGLFATGTLTGATALSNTFSGNLVGAVLQDATGFTFGNTGDGNQVTGGTLGIIGRGVLDNSQVLGNTVTGVQTGIVLVDARGSSSAAPFRVGGTATTTGAGVGNNVTATLLALHARGVLTNTFVAGNIFKATAAGGNGAALVTAAGLTLGGFAAGDGNILTAALGNGLYASGLCNGTRVYRNNITASQYGILLDSARNLFVGFLYNTSVGNTVQYNQVGLFTTGTNTGTGVTYTNWFRNVRKVSNAGNVFIYPA